MVGVALLMAMVIVLQFVGGMIPPIGGTVSISLVLIPIVLGSAVFGPGAGALLGGTFAVVTIINCITGADAGGAMVFQANPVLCILVVGAKSILAGRTRKSLSHAHIICITPNASYACRRFICKEKADSRSCQLFGINFTSFYVRSSQYYFLQG